MSQEIQGSLRPPLTLVSLLGCVPVDCPTALKDKRQELAPDTASILEQALMKDLSPLFHGGRGWVEGLIRQLAFHLMKRRPRCVTSIVHMFTKLKMMNLLSNFLVNLRDVV